MTTDEWLQAVLATAPPLSDAQIVEIGRVFRAVLPHMQAAPATAAGAARHDASYADPADASRRT